jgi:hypothetical protein
MRANRFGLQAAAAPRDTGTCERAELGALAALGANDHPTFLYQLLGHGPRPDPRRKGCQAPKAAFVPPLQEMASGDAAFTSIAPLSVARIGDSAITFVPAELTTAAGLEIKAAVAKAFEAAKDPVVPIIGGLTNGYIQYVTTPEEYSAQGYEGASNLFGPGSGPLFVRVARALSLNLLDHQAALPGEPDVAHPFEYSLGPERARLPRGEGQTPLGEVAAQRRTLDFCTARRTGPLAICLVWSDAAPGIARVNEERWVGLATARELRPTVVLDDRGTAFRTSVHGAVHDLWVWSTLVQPTSAEWATIGAGRNLRVVTNLDDSATPESPTFSVDQPPRDCTKAEQRFCGI